MRRAWVLLAVVLVSGVLAASAPPAERPPLIGANFTHYRNPDCSLADSGLVATYDQPGVRRRVRAELAAMRAARVQTLRLLLWHMSDATGQRWGVVPSAGGRLPEPYRSNLIRYLSDVRRAGFERLMLVFAPSGTNNPVLDSYDPTSFDENWRFVEDVRPLLKRYGPSVTTVELLPDGTPPRTAVPARLARIQGYVTQIWARYVDAFGNADASFPTAGVNGATDTVSRLQTLVAALRESGRPLPRWFDVHPPYDGDTTLPELQAVDSALTADGLPQPLVIAETAYDDRSVAAAIARFAAASSRPLLEVLEWPLTAGRPCPAISVSAPYRVDAYLTALTGVPPPAATPSPLPLPPVPTLHATVGPGGATSLRTASGHAVSVLDSGRYRIVVSDRSRRDGFHLLGPDVDRSTGLAFRGTVTWLLDIGAGVPYGSAYSYRSDGSGTRGGSFRIH